MHKLCNGKVPPLDPTLFNEQDQQLIQEIQLAPTRVSELIEQYKFRDALYEVIDLARKGNQYMQKKEPWILAKQLESNPAIQKEIDNCLHLCLQLTANLAILVNPFLPNTASKLLHMMKVVDRLLEWENAGKLNLLNKGYPLRAPELLFRKIEDTEIEIQLEKLRKGIMSTTPSSPAQPETTATAKKAEIQYDDFAKLELKTGRIIAAEKVEKADKLLKLEVELGTEKRTIVSGIALYFDPASIIGQTVTVVTNLAPRKMRGIESNGMILMATDAAGKLHFLKTDDSVEPGSLIS